ncbi:MAG: CAP domain-containing protein, partial [Planctomycetes bacterium]|nr:CAP domain-containing protein [Planctomycetota bacterium]
KSSKKSKNFEELKTALQKINAIYRKPYSTFALSSICIEMGRNIVKLTENCKNAGLCEKDIGFIKADDTKELVRKLSEILKTEKLFTLAKQLNCTKNNRNKLSKRVTQFEQIWVKTLKHEKVGKIVNADVFSFISENADAIETGIKSLNKAELELLNLINAFREEIGLIPLIVKSKTLKTATDNYIQMMIKMENISHIGSDGSNPAQRAKKSGFKGKSIGENLYRGIKNANLPENVLNSWFHSAEHLKNIISNDFDSCGVSKSGYNWCMLFGGP